MSRVPVMERPARGKVGERIQQARREAGLTQEQLADLVGVTPRTIQAYEGGHVDAYRKLPKLAESLGRPSSWLQHGENGNGPTEENDRLERILEELAELRRQLDSLSAHVRRLQP